MQLRFLGMTRGQRGPLPRPVTPAQLAALWSPAEQAQVARMLAGSAVGAPATVRTRLQAIVDATGADELIVACGVHDHGGRVRSYELLSGVGAALRPAEASSPL